MTLTREEELTIQRLGQSAAERVNKKSATSDTSYSRIIAQVTAVNTSARTIDTSQMTDIPYTSSCTNIAKGNTAIVEVDHHQAICIGVLNEAAPTWKEVYPVGAVYISYVSTSPASLFGGSWTQITGRFLRAANDVSTGGSDSHTLTVAQMPSHMHTLKTYNANNTNYKMATPGFRLHSSAGSWISSGGTTAGSVYGDSAGGTDYNGSTQAHNNMPAYQDLYVWRRIA